MRRAGVCSRRRGRSTGCYAVEVTRPGSGRVQLIGTGPGDPALLTVRARECLAEADVVLHDAPLPPDLLALAPADAELRYVGPGAMEGAMRQAAEAGQTVVRLEGGDPFLFGHGLEEAATLAAAGIPFEVVPGVPAPQAASAYAGLALTGPGAASVAYLRVAEPAEEKGGEHDWSKLATATPTLVIVLETRTPTIAGIMNRLVEHGRSPSAPAAVVQSASLPTQRTLVGTVGDLAARAGAAEIGSPSLIVVGELVRFRERLRWFDTRPLFGRGVLILRAPHQARALERAVRAHGGRPILAPTIAIEPPTDLAPLREAARTVGHYDWVVFTSRNAVEAFWEALEATGGDTRRLGAARVCAVGRKTAAALEGRGIRPDRVPSKERADGIVATLLAELQPKSRVLCPRAEEGREIVGRGLREAGHRVTEVAAYRTVPAGDPTSLRGALGDADAVIFTSPSTLRNLLACLDEDELAGKTLASIGPVTSQALAAAGLAADVEAPQPTIEALVEALVRHYERPS